MKSKRVLIPHIRLFMMPLKLFLDIGTSSPVDVTTRVAWMFSWRIKTQALGLATWQNYRHTIGCFLDPLGISKTGSGLK